MSPRSRSVTGSHASMRSRSWNGWTASASPEEWATRASCSDANACQLGWFSPSLVASLKLRMPLPIPRPISGRRFAPKIRMMIMRMVMSSGMPTRPSIAAPFSYGDYGGPMDCTTTRSGRLLAIGAITATIVLFGPGRPAVAQFASGVNVVEVYAAVVDKAGNPVQGLRREDFTVLEDGRPQTLSTFTEGDFPLSVAIGIDRSFSMAPKPGSSRPSLSSSVSAARTFLGELRPADESMVVAIGSEIETIAALSTDR